MTSPDTEFIRILGAAPEDGVAPTRPAAKSLPTSLPVLGLSDVVVFPGMIAPLVVDTAQSIRLIDEVVEGDRLLALVLQRRPEIDNPQPEDLWELGCGARVPGDAPDPFNCPNTESGDGRDHVLVPDPPPETARCSIAGSPQPFMRHRELLWTYRLARVERVAYQ